jgi:hypothetical protein
MAKILTKKAIQEVLKKLQEVSVSPVEKLKLLKEMNAFVKKTDDIVGRLLEKVRAEYR